MLNFSNGGSRLFVGDGTRGLLDGVDSSMLMVSGRVRMRASFKACLDLLVFDEYFVVPRADWSLPSSPLFKGRLDVFDLSTDRVVVVDFPVVVWYDFVVDACCWNVVADTVLGCFCVTREKS